MIRIKELKLKSSPVYETVDVEYTDEEIEEIFFGDTADTHITLALLRRARNAEAKVEKLKSAVQKHRDKPFIIIPVQAAEANLELWSVLDEVKDEPSS